MENPQRYISDELTHFVGRGKTEKEQYDLLVWRILKTGWLTYGPEHDPTKHRTARLNLSKPLSQDLTIDYQVICFCDIPVSELSIHMNKYGRFGLAFNKSFLIGAGACPVFYVANDSLVRGITKLFCPGDFADWIRSADEANRIDRALYFSTTVRAILDILIALDVMCNDARESYFPGRSASDFKGRLCALFGLDEEKCRLLERILDNNAQASETLRMCTDFLVNYVFSFIKCFDAKRSFQDAENFYMEREWRLAKNLNFQLNEVSRVFIPSKYASQFREDLPDYTGQINFVD